MPAAVDRRFDVVWFGGRPKLLDRHFETLLNGQAAQGRGHFMVMPTTRRRSQVEEAGNLLAHYDSSLTKAQRAPQGQQGRWRSVKPAKVADEIARAHELGGLDDPRPLAFPTGWIFMNELSRRLWLDEPRYRSWVIELVQRLATHGYKPVVFSPITKAGGPAAEGLAADWRALAADAKIAIEGYLAGSDIVAQGDGAADWCADRYREMKNAFVAVGVPAGRLFLTEHFAQTKASGPGPRGRWGVSPNEWSDAIEARCAGARSVGFGGYVTYAWMYNQMEVSEADLIRFSKTYVKSAGRNKLGFAAPPS